MGFGRYSGEAEKAQFHQSITICMAVQAGDIARPICHNAAAIGNCKGYRSPLDPPWVGFFLG
jgi:hypothetical protein